MPSWTDMQIAAITNLGLVREVNEDRYYLKRLEGQTLLMAVVDGMGGGPAGSAAAETVRQAIANFAVEEREPEAVLAELVVTASEALLEFEESHTDLEGMGATVTVTYLANGTAHYAHVGDTRFCVFRRGRLIQVTTDQTMAQLLVEEGKITADEARTHPYGNLLDQCVGCPMCEPVTGTFPIEEGDVLLHTTDGLHDAISEKDMLAILSTPHDSVNLTADALIQAALGGGGKDNMTVVIAEVSGQKVHHQQA